MDGAPNWGRTTGEWGADAAPDAGPWVNGGRFVGAFPWGIAEDSEYARAARALRAAAAAAATDDRLRTRASSGVSAAGP